MNKSIKGALMGMVAGSLTALLLVSCSGGEKIVPTTGNLEPGTMMVIPETYWYIVTQEELDRLYRLNAGELPHGEEISGFTGVAPDGTIVVYTTSPRYVDGEETTILGHEIMHNVLGQYHR